ncbi:hypothetical protein JHK82_023731 [Glycine max]|nr:hypothetical protein JHK82_023731 [Glycine max]
MKPMPTTRNLNVLLIFWSLFSLFMAGYGAESDIYCLQTIKKLDRFNNLPSWDFESNTEGDICKFNGVECWNQHDVEDRVISLLLSSKGLKGKFPQCIENFTWLQTLDLSHNQLSGYIPSDISTKLPCEIPQEFVLLYRLRDFSVANNLLEGPVPVFVSNVDVGEH